MAHYNDRNDLLLISRRDQAALRRLYDRHARMIGRRLTRMSKDAELVEEVIQDTFLVIWKSPDSYSGSGAVPAWIWGIARNTMLNSLRGETVRGRGRTLPLSMVTAPLVSEGVDPDTEIVLEHAISTMAPGMRATYRLVAEGYSAVEVAEILNVSPATVRTRMHRIRRVVRDHLDRS